VKDSVILREVAQLSGRISYNRNVFFRRWLMFEMTGAAIAKIAFDEFVKSSAGEVAKKAVGGAIEQLRSTIKNRFKGNQKAETAIEKIEKEQSPEALNKLSVYLDDEMEDVAFAQTLQQLAEQITNVQNTAERQYINQGRDQVNIENITGNPKIGGS
jgi:uncharacterized damage-inducible protein DinB